MPGLRSAVLLLVAASCGFLLLLAASASASSSSSRPPAVYGVGVGDGTDETLGEWAMRHRFYVGDVLGKLIDPAGTPSAKRNDG